MSAYSMMSEAYLVMEMMYMTMMKRTENKMRMKLLWTMPTIAVVVFVMMLVPTFATHISSTKYPSYYFVEYKPQWGCTADGKACAKAYLNGLSYNYNKVNQVGEKRNDAITRENQYRPSNSIGSLPQVIVSSSTSIAHDVRVDIRGKHTNPVGGVTYFYYGGDRWKFDSTFGQWNWYDSFQTYVSGNGEKSITATVRLYIGTHPTGTWRLGAHYQTLAQNVSGAPTTITDYYYTPYYINTLALQICHPATPSTACPG